MGQTFASFWDLFVPALTFKGVYLSQTPLSGVNQIVFSSALVRFSPLTVDRSYLCFATERVYN